MRRKTINGKAKSHLNKRINQKTNGVKKGMQPVKCPSQTTTIITKSVSTNLSNIPDYLNSNEHKEKGQKQSWKLFEKVEIQHGYNFTQDDVQIYLNTILKIVWSQLSHNW